MRTLKLTISYDGNGFYGFQRQKERLTIQSELESKIGLMIGNKITIKYAGRTDTGVHAKMQVVSYSDNGNIPFDKIKHILNNLLTNIQVVKVEEVLEDFNPRKDALFREYEYWIYTGKQNIFLDKYMLHVNELNINLLNRLLSKLIGLRDCKNLCYNPGQYRSTVREICKAQIVKMPFSFLNIDAEAYCFSIKAKSFMYHMVRKIVGLILEVNNGIITESYYSEIVSAEPCSSWKMAPAKALFLKEIEY